MTLRGVDVSLYQGAIDWKAAKAAGFTFGIARCVRETLTVDDRFRTNLKGMRDAGILPGAYVFLNTGMAKVQAATFISELKAVGGPTGILCVVDIERNSDGSVPTLEHVTNFAKAFHDAFPNHPLGFYGSNALTGLGNLTGLYNYLWVANYGTNPEGNWPDTYKARGGDASPVWSDKRNGFLPLLWQFSSKGRVPWDSSARIDFNACRSTLDQLKASAGIVVAPPPAPKIYTQAEYDAAQEASYDLGYKAGAASIDPVAEFNKGVIAASSAALGAKK